MDDGEATIRLREKGDKRRTIGPYPVAGQAVEEDIQHAGPTSGPVFRPAVLLFPKGLPTAPWAK